YAGQVLGCDTSCALEIEKKVDCFLYIGTGEFHPLGVFIKTNKPVFILNPFSKKTRQISGKERVAYERRRSIVISKAKDAYNYGILVSIKPGQNNLKKALEIKKKIEKKGKFAFIFLFDTLDSKEFLNFNWIEAWINTACPRIIDDSFEKPVINAEEFSI
ncbi:MAG: diphthamide synthesis protein, partial [Candidatus Woesearchaeota archaeon]